MYLTICTEALECWQRFLFVFNEVVTKEASNPLIYRESRSQNVEVGLGHASVEWKLAAHGTGPERPPTAAPDAGAGMRTGAAGRWRSRARKRNGWRPTRSAAPPPCRRRAGSRSC